MAVVHKCDLCKKNLTGDKVTAGVGKWFAYDIELCLGCGDPIVKFLKQHKLIAEPETTAIISN